MAVGSGAQAHRRAADGDQHLAADRLPGLSPGRPAGRLGRACRRGRRAVHGRADGVDALAHIAASHTRLLGRAHVPARVGPIPAHRPAASTHHARSVGGHPAALLGRRLGHPRGCADGLDVLGATARPACGAALGRDRTRTGGTDGPRVERDARRRLARGGARGAADRRGHSPTVRS